jgi:hypothetical protein
MGGIMSNTTTTPQMSLVIPVVGVEVGPTWASDIVTAFYLIDTHDHTYGHGNYIKTGAILIDGDLTFNSYNLTSVKSVRTTSQVSTLVGVQAYLYSD